MTRDYGARAPRKKIGAPAMVAGAIAVIAVCVAGNWWLHRPGAIRKAQEWAITGPPCPEVSARAFQAQPVRIHERLEDNDIVFGRGYGHVSCDNIVNDGGKGVGFFTECQFTSPGAIQVTTKAGDTYFLTKVSPATVSVKKGVPSCVLAANFKGEQSVPGE
jgi:hypothetical protein